MLLSCTFTATLGIFFSVKKEQKDLHTHTLLIIQEEMNKTLCHTINWVLLGRVGSQKKLWKLCYTIEFAIFGHHSRVENRTEELQRENARRTLRGDRSPLS